MSSEGQVQTKTPKRRFEGKETQPKKKRKTIETLPDSNWKNIKEALPKPLPKKEPTPPPKWFVAREAEKQKKLEEQRAKEEAKKNAPPQLPEPTGDSADPTKILALDCEMVGVGPGGFTSALAQITIINSFGNVVYSRYVKPVEAITDFRTKYSGIKPIHMKKASDFKIVQKEVAALIKGRIIVGHGLKNDFQALMLGHPFQLTRDTAKYRPVQRAKGRPHALKYLTKKYLQIDIQSGSHDPVEDARASLALYKHFSKDWERIIENKRYGTKKKKRKNTSSSSDSSSNSGSDGSDDSSASSSD